MTDYPPALILLVGVVLLPLLKGRVRWTVAFALPVIALADAWAVIQAGTDSFVPFIGMQLNPVHVHAATPVFATVFAIMVLGGLLYALNQKRESELPAACLYAGGALGVLFCGDLVSMFVFWEVMTLGSTVLIWAGRQNDSYGAGMRYFGMHAAGGVMLLMGIIIVISQRIHAGDPNPLEFRHFDAMVDSWSTLSWQSGGMWLILLGMLVNAGAPPFSSWIPDAYPQGSPSGTVMLSAFTTKTAVFTLLVAFSGVEVVIYFGLYMAIYGVIYGLLENDIRRLLSYSLVNQVGFMLVGIGIGTRLSIDGAAGHAFAHIIYKALLFMATGSVLFATGRTKMNQLGGLYKSMPVTMWCLIIGGLSISGFPFTSGFTSKSMVVQAIVNESARMAELGQPHTYLIVTWFLFEAATAGVFIDACVKLTWFVFFQKDSGLRPPEVPWNMKAAMIGFAGICIFLGFFPGPLYAILPYKAEAADYANVVFSIDHVMVMLGMLAFSGLSFFVLLPLMKRTESITLDVDWIWRRFIPKFWHDVATPILQQLASVQKLLLDFLPGNGSSDAGSMPTIVRRRLPGSWAVSVPVFMISAMLLLYLVIYFWLLPAQGG
ncbi:MAG: Na(+)/H(+) antiporter subunit D [Planctomycetes bacterium]|nr:Na(+)/H(+) antiporter subunit D [Planctomycetota bacterium]